MYAGADAFLMPSRFEPCGQGQMIAMRYGTLPVVRATGGLRDTVIDADADPVNGTGFVFGPAEPVALAEACRRAMDALADEPRRRAIQQRGMAVDFSWRRPRARLRPDVPARDRDQRRPLTTLSIRRRLTSVGLVVAVVVGALSALAPAAAAANPAITSFSVSGAPFAADFAPLPTQATISAVLSRRATVTVTIRRPSGKLVRSLATNVTKNAGARTWHWDGRDASGQLAADGPYVSRILVTSNTGTERADRPLRKGLPAIYPANPGAIVIVVNPGHGGRFSGAVNGPYMEKDYNLAIALQLKALLERAGVTVVMTRTTDVAVNEPASDLNGDGVLDRYDDDLARSDIANEARADIAVHVHNNGAPNPNAHGTEAYTDGHRTWTPEGLDLASDVLRGVYGSLDSYRSATFQPKNAGVHEGWYYYMGPYDPPFLIRAALMTSVLSESLFVTNASELAALQRPDIQLAIAAGIYLGVADYLNARPFGVGYALVSGPTRWLPALPRSTRSASRIAATRPRAAGS